MTSQNVISLLISQLVTFHYSLFTSVALHTKCSIRSARSPGSMSMTGISIIV